jgi:hypothetical protein
MIDLQRPSVRIGERYFILLYVRKSALRPMGEPAEIIGFTVSVHFGRKLKASYILSACGADWKPVENVFFESIDKLILVSEVFFHIALSEWIGCHPEKNKKLYARRRTRIERLHRSLIKKIDSIRTNKLGYADYYRMAAKYAGIADGSVEGTS